MKKKLFIDVTLTILAVLVGVFFFVLVRQSRTLQAEVSGYHARAKILLQEIGQTKEENLWLSQQLRDTNNRIKELEKTLVTAAPRPAQSEPTQPADQKDNGAQTKEIRQVIQQSEVPQTYNFLLVGHNSRLADTIILAAVDRDNKRITLVSIPRDLMVNGRKINGYLSLYGIEALKERVTEASGVPIHRYAVVDFSAFEKIIDALGGVDVYVDKDIYDPLFPNWNGGYEPYAISAGSQHLSGKDALRFARSRKSTSDFDRAARQQKILRAIHARLINLDVIGDFGTIKEIFEAAKKGTETDMGLLELAGYLKEFNSYTISKDNVMSPSNILYPTTGIDGAYLLMVKGGGYTKAHQFVLDAIRQSAEGL